MSRPRMQGMTPGETFWPGERVFVVLTAKGRIAKEHGRPMFFMDYMGAREAAKPGYLIGAIDILRVTTITSNEGASA